MREVTGGTTREKSSARKVVAGLLFLSVCFFLLLHSLKIDKQCTRACACVRVCAYTQLCNAPLFRASYFDRCARCNASLMALAYVRAYLCALSSDTLTFHTSHAVCYTLCRRQLQRVVHSGFGQQRRKQRKENKSTASYTIVGSRRIDDWS